MAIEVSVEIFDMPDRDVAAQRLIVIANEIRAGRYGASYSVSKDGNDQRVFVLEQDVEEENQ